MFFQLPSIRHILVVDLKIVVSITCSRHVVYTIYQEVVSI